jgi:hypothetical protein
LPEFLAEYASDTLWALMVFLLVSTLLATLGRLVLGFGFLWTDLVCYSVGVIIGIIAEWAIVGIRGSREA